MATGFLKEMKHKIKCPLQCPLFKLNRIKPLVSNLGLTDAVTE